MIIWRPSSLSELIPMIFKTWLTHLGSEAFKYTFLCILIVYCHGNIKWSLFTNVLDYLAYSFRLIYFQDIKLLKFCNLGLKMQLRFTRPNEQNVTHSKSEAVSSFSIVFQYSKELNYFISSKYLNSCIIFLWNYLLSSYLCQSSK